MKTKITSDLYSWTNQAFLDVEIEHEGKTYQWQGLMDGRLSTYEVCDDTSTPIEDEKLWQTISEFAIQTLENERSDLLNKSLDKIEYQG